MSNLQKVLCMGTIRLLLAIAVVFSHSYGYLLVGGRLAVQLFYIISGYLISFILIELKSYHSIKKFYLNRFLRLFPAYYFISFLTLIFFVYLSFNNNVPFFDVFDKINIFGKIYLILSNFLIVGQDLAFFMGVKDGNIRFLSDWTNSEIVIYQGHISHISWTLSLEIMFYFIAPFILKNKKIIIYILVSSILLRAFLIHDGIGMTGGFNYRFFPLELGLFLLGALSHQIIKTILKNYLKNKFDLISEYVTYFIITYIIFFSFIPGIVINTLLMIALLIVSLPLIFNFQNNHKWDAWIGKFSYPIYICHFIVVVAAQEFFPEQKHTWLIFILLATLLLAFITEYLINKPIEKMRNRNRNTA